MPNSITPLISNCITSEKFEKKYKEGYTRGFTPRQFEETTKTKNKAITTHITKYKALQTQRAFCARKSMTTCGLIPIDDNAPCTLEISSEGVHVGGVGFCRSPWCVNCMAYARGERIDKIKNGIIQAREHDYKAFFVTLTIPRSHDPSKQLSTLSQGFKALLDKLTYRCRKEGVKYWYVKNIDVTFKLDIKDVYHTHLHCIFIIDKEVSYLDSKIRDNHDDKRLNVHEDIPTIEQIRGGKKAPYVIGYKHQINSFQDMILLAWYDVNQTKKVLVSSLGQKVIEIKKDEGLSRYVAKFQGIAHELANFQHKNPSQTKQGHGLVDKYQSIGFMALLGCVADGDPKAIRVYQTFLRANYKKRTVSFSRSWSKKNEAAEIIEYLDLPWEMEETDETEEKEPDIKIDCSPSQYYLLKDFGLDDVGLCVHYGYLYDDIKIFMKLMSRPLDKRTETAIINWLTFQRSCILQRVCKGKKTPLL